MRSMRLIAMMTAAAAGFGPAFANAEDIALSLRHPKGSVDVPVSAIGPVEAVATHRGPRRRTSILTISK